MEACARKVKTSLSTAGVNILEVLVGKQQFVEKPGYYFETTYASEVRFLRSDGVIGAIN